MTQQIDHPYAPYQGRETHPGYQADPATHGWPAPGAPVPGYPPPSAYATPPAGILPSAQPVAPSGGGRLWIVVGALVAVVVVLGGVLGWLLLAPSTAPAPAAPAPTSQPTDQAPAAPSQDSPAVAAAARQQLAAALNRYSQAATRFGQDAETAKNSGDIEAMRRVVTDFRAATYGFDAEIRAITFPNEQQTIVNAQLLPATGRLIGDLDQFANLDPATVRSSGTRVMSDLQTSMSLTQQVMSGLGG